MNEESKQPQIDPEIGARIVALVLGEASDFEREELNRLIELRPELAAFKLQMQQVHGVLQDVGTGEFEAPGEDWKLPADKRNAVLAVIRGEATVEAAAAVVDQPGQRMSATRSMRWKFAKVAVGVCVAGFVGIMAVQWSFISQEKAASEYFSEALLGDVRYNREPVSSMVASLDSAEVPGTLSYAESKHWSSPVVVLSDGSVRSSVALSSLKDMIGANSSLDFRENVYTDLEPVPEQFEFDVPVEAIAELSARVVESQGRVSAVMETAPASGPEAVEMPQLIAQNDSTWAYKGLRDEAQSWFGSQPTVPNADDRTPVGPAIADGSEQQPTSERFQGRDSDDEAAVPKGARDQEELNATGVIAGVAVNKRMPELSDVSSPEPKSKLYFSNAVGDFPAPAAATPQHEQTQQQLLGRGFSSHDFNIQEKKVLSATGEDEPDGERFGLTDPLMADVELAEPTVPTDVAAYRNLDNLFGGKSGRSNSSRTTKDLDDLLGAESGQNNSGGTTSNVGGFAGGSSGGFSGGGGFGTEGGRTGGRGLNGLAGVAALGKLPAMDELSDKESSIEKREEIAAGDYFVGGRMSAPAPFDDSGVETLSRPKVPLAIRWGQTLIAGEEYVVELAEEVGPASTMNIAGPSLAAASTSPANNTALTELEALQRITEVVIPTEEFKKKKKSDRMSRGGDVAAIEGRLQQNDARYRVQIPSRESAAKTRAIQPGKDGEETQRYTVNTPADGPRFEMGLGVAGKGPVFYSKGPVLQVENLPSRSTVQQIELRAMPSELVNGIVEKTLRQIVPVLEDESKSMKRPAVKKIAPPAGFQETLAANDAFSTFSLHVSDVSFKLAFAALGRGEWPEAAKVRIEEFVNAFDYGDPMPCNGEKVACRVEQTIHPFVQQRNLLRVSMRTAAVGRASTTPLRLTFLLDNSGSMERIDRQKSVRRAFALLAQQLTPIDQVTLISFARQPRLLADKVGGTDAGKLVQLIDNLPSEGGTNIEAALQLAFEKAREQQTPNAQNRIILLTDGAVNLGNANPESLSQMVTTMRSSGIAFDAAGISAEGLNDEVLEALTRQGDGRYYLLDSFEDADVGFARQIAGALRPSAKNVKVQVEFNPKRVGRYKLLGFEKHILKKEDFRNDKVDAAEMAAAEAGVAMYRFEALPDGEGDVGSVSVRFRDLSTDQMIEHRWPIPYEADAPRADQAAPSLRIATSAALLAAKLRGEPLGESVDLQALSHLMSGLPDQDRSDQRVQQLQQMIEQARQLSRR